jgi:hypothetical protein
MSKINTTTRIIAGDPIELEDRRFLPSVLVTEIKSAETDMGGFYGTRVRPISVIEQGPNRNRWHAIPNTTGNALSVMAGVGVGVAVVSALIILVTKLLRD